MLGKTIGNYRVTGEIGAGGMGAVYEAEHALLGKKAAVKVLLPELSNNRSIVERFFNEAKATALIRHPGIVEIFDYGHLESGHAYIVMERLDGESLADRLRHKAPLPPVEAIAIARHIAGVLASAHEHGIVHRDLKPDNVFLVPDPAVPGGERAKILDFGIAKLASGTGSGSVRTQTGAVMGTPVYMSPEQCRGAGAVDRRADIYSLGCVLYEMVCGRPPFSAEGAGEILAAHIHLEPPAPSTVRPTVPAALERVILRLLAKDPNDRCGSMEEVIAALDDASGHRHATAKPTPSAVAAGVAPTMPTPVGTPAGPVPTTLGSAAGQSLQLDPEPARSAGRWLVPALVGIAAVGVAGALVVKAGGGGDEPGAAAAAPAATEPVAEQPPIAEPPVAESPAAPEPTHVTLHIESQPTGADVFRAADGVKVGTTPHDAKVLRGPGEAVFILKRRGYDDERVAISTERDVERSVELSRRRRGKRDRDAKRSAKKTETKQSETKKTETNKAETKKTETKPVKDGAYDPFGDTGGEDGARSPFRQ